MITISPRRLLGTVLGVLLIGALVVLTWPGNAQPANTRMPVSAAVEAHHGVRFTMVGATGDGGLLDVRFKVLDPNLAGKMVERPMNLPKLIVERDGVTMPSAALLGMLHNLVPGRTYYYLYRNSGGHVRSGDRVALAFDDAVLRHVTVR